MPLNAFKDVINSKKGSHNSQNGAPSSIIDVLDLVSEDWPCQRARTEYWYSWLLLNVYFLINIKWNALNSNK